MGANESSVTGRRWQRWLHVALLITLATACGCSTSSRGGTSLRVGRVEFVRQPVAEADVRHRESFTVPKHVADVVPAEALPRELEAYSAAPGPDRWAAVVGSRGSRLATQLRLFTKDWRPVGQVELPPPPKERRLVVAEWNRAGTGLAVLVVDADDEGGDAEVYLLRPPSLSLRRLWRAEKHADGAFSKLLWPNDEIVYVTTTPGGGGDTILAIDAASGSAREVYRDETGNDSPIGYVNVSPDGRLLAFDRYQMIMGRGRAEVRVVDLRTGDTVQVVRARRGTTHDGYLIGFEDDRCLLFVKPGPGAAEPSTAHTSTSRWGNTRVTAGSADGSMPKHRLSHGECLPRPPRARVHYSGGGHDAHE